MMPCSQVQCSIILPLLEDDFETATILSALALRNSAASILLVQGCAGRAPSLVVTDGACFSFGPVVFLGFHTVGTSQGDIQRTIASTGILWHFFCIAASGCICIESCFLF
jgi:hypothetical protein